MADEALRVFPKGVVKGVLARIMDGIGLTVMHLVWGHEADAGVVVVLVVPGEEAAAEGLCVLDAAEALGEFRAIF